MKDLLKLVSEEGEDGSSGGGAGVLRKVGGVLKGIFYGGRRKNTNEELQSSLMDNQYS